MAGRPSMSGSRSASDEPRRSFDTSVPAGRRSWAWEPESPPATRVMHRLIRLISPSLVVIAINKSSLHFALAL